jgi:alkylation response protein AidB-like acyl-CoA dehydrogenase
MISSEFIAENDLKIFHEKAGEAEHLKVLHPDQLTVIRKYQLFKMFIPARLGGAGMTLPEILKVEEAISYQDGSSGWVITLCSGAGWFVGFVAPELQSLYFSAKDVCIAGSGAATGKAERIDNGYLLNGYWKYATGALHATAFTVNCAITKNEKPLFNEDGSLMIRSFIVPQELVRIESTWNGMGMIATGSHSFKIQNCKVPINNLFQIDPKSATLSDPIFQYPFLQLAESTLAINLSGMLLRFLDLCTDLFANQNKTSLLIGVNKHRKKFEKTRVKLLASVDRSWGDVLTRQQVSQTLLQVSDLSYELTRLAREIVNDLFPQCGLSSTFLNTEINRVWRNFITAAQHPLLNKLH